MPRQLFRPSSPVRALVTYLWLALLLNGILPELQRVLGWSPSVLVLWIQLICGLIWLPALVYAKWLHRRQQDQIQAERNSRAQDLAALLSAVREQTSAGPIQSYVLYLRPFITTGHLPFPLSREDATFSDRFLYGSKFDFESWLGKAAREGAPSWNLYAIGSFGGGIGADKITARDEEWKGVFTLLANQAYAIVVCSFDQPGTRWEIDEIISSPELLRKTIFALPPARRFWRRRDLAASWERTRQRLHAKVAAFPRYVPGHVLFALRSEDFTVVELQRGRVSISRFKAIVLGIHVSSDIERLWGSAPTEVRAEVPVLFRKMSARPETTRCHPRLVATTSVELFDVFRNPERRVALEWLINNHLVFRDDAYSALDARVRLHPAVLAWPRARAWLADTEHGSGGLALYNREHRSRVVAALGAISYPICHPRMF